MNATEAFFDTNILLYTVGGDAAKAARAEDLLREGGTVSVQVLTEFTDVA
jgi:predicted nucleic acid-binding protein